MVSSTKCEDGTSEKPHAPSVSVRPRCMSGWRCPPGLLLPGGLAVDWLAAGTYDRSVGLSLFTLQITHKIDENTDAERDHVVGAITGADPAAGLRVIRDFSTGYHARNGGGDTISTDGNLPIVHLRQTVAEPTAAGLL